MRRLAIPFGLLLLASHGLSLSALAEESDHARQIRSSYTKYEHRIEMRDGAKLFTSVYLPNDLSKNYPILLQRTPYGVHPYGADQYRQSLGPYEEYVDEGFIFVYQDVRGRYLSEGDFDNMRPHLARKGKTDTDESTDTWDTIEWLVQNVPGNNGRVGQWGISYPGFYTAAGMIDSHPALKAVSPQAPIADWYWDDMHHHGALVLPLTFNFFSGFGVPRPEPTEERADFFEHETADGYQFFLDLGPLSNVNEQHFEGEIPFWNDLAAHPNYDEFWQSRSILPHLRNIDAAVMTVGGWFDTEDLYGPLHIYESVEEKNPNAFNILIMGPWSHGGWTRTAGRKLGSADFGFETSEYYQTHVELPFFKHFLKGDGSRDSESESLQELNLPEALVFETGANRWRRFDSWPPEEAAAKSLYFLPAGELGFEPPDCVPSETDLCVDSFTSDPAKPVPYTMEITPWWARNYMTEDQRFAGWRPDVLVYQTEPLEEDLTLAGPITADLWVTTTGTDADWVVKVIDVLPAEEFTRGAESNPGGRQQLVRGEVFRGRFRESYETPKPFTPNEPTAVKFELWDVLHTFKRGHRLMVQVQSTWFPFIDRNPQTYVDNIFEAEEDDFVKAEHGVLRRDSRGSRLQVTVVE